jgi:hypothetical protein
VLEHFTVDTFAGRVGEAFHIVASEDVAIEAVVVEVQTWGEESARGRGRQPFGVVFRGPRQPVLPQRTYRVEHREIGTFDLFIVPIGPDADGMRYEAVFS